MKNQHYNELKYLFSCYFNQDWVLDYENPESVIKAYVFETHEDSIQSTLQEIQKLKNENYEQEKLWSFICEPLGCYCRPPNMDGKEWLDFVSNTIKKYLIEKQKLEEGESIEDNGHKI